jgi:tRNA A-37 threonylcarbamoyl transferase component Bud32
MSDTALAGFELIEKLGEGGMGVVWKARQRSLDRWVAIKLLPERLSHDAENIRLIMHEARIAAKLKHPGIVQVYDANEQGGVCFFVMEYVSGYSVGQWLARKKILTEKDALTVAECVAVALDYAWRAAGLIHCDIKPDNIMVDQDGTIKVSDLGLSITRDARQGAGQGDIMGTPGYMAPERVAGEVALDCRTDIYALGCMVYQMVTGRRPFQEFPDRQAMECHLDRQLPDPRELNPGVSAGACALLERMLAKNRDFRTPDWKAFLADLHRVQKGFMPAGKAPPAGASTVSCRKLILPSEKPPAPEIPREAPRGRGARLALLLLLLVLAAALGVWKYVTEREAGPAGAPDSPSPAEAATGPVAPPAADRRGGVVEAPPAQDDIRQVEARRQAALQAAVASLRNAARQYEARGAFADGAEWLDEYAGPLALDTLAIRQELAAGLRQKAQAKAEEQARAAVWEDALSQAAADLLAGRYAAAEQRFAALAGDPGQQTHQAELASIREVCSAVTHPDDLILASFKAQLGQPVSIHMNHGTPLVVKILEVRDRVIRCATTDDDEAQLSLRYEDLSATERRNRLARLEGPGGALIRGLMAFAAGRKDEARDGFARMGTALATPLMARCQEEDSPPAPVEDPVQETFHALLEQAGIRVGAFDEPAWREAIGSARLSRRQAEILGDDLDRFLARHGEGEFVAANQPLILVLQQAIHEARRGGGAGDDPARFRSPRRADALPRDSR